MAMPIAKTQTQFPTTEVMSVLFCMQAKSQKSKQTRADILCHLFQTQKITPENVNDYLFSAAEHFRRMLSLQGFNLEVQGMDPAIIKAKEFILAYRFGMSAEVVSSSLQLAIQQINEPMVSLVSVGAFSCLRPMSFGTNTQSQVSEKRSISGASGKKPYAVPLYARRAAYGDGFVIDRSNRR